MIYFKSCPRCHGDVVVEEWMGEKEATCLQCGFRAGLQAAGTARPAVAGRRAA